MKEYKQIYIDHFNYKKGDFIPSEISGEAAVHFHHVHRRGRGNEGEPERVENIMAVTFQEHIGYGDKKQFKSMLYKIHKARLKELGKPFDEIWLDAQIEKYESFETK